MKQHIHTKQLTQTSVCALTLPRSWQGCITRKNGIITVETFHAKEDGEPLVMLDLVQAQTHKR
jgi:hypothetical protein